MVKNRLLARSRMRVLGLVALCMMVGTAVAADAVTDPAFRRAIELDLAMANRGLPMIDEGMRQEKVRFDGSTVLYEFTMLRLTAAEIRALDPVKIIRPDIFSGLCSSAPNIATMKAGATYRYIYRGKDGGVGADFTVTADECRGSARHEAPAVRCARLRLRKFFGSSLQLVNQCSNRSVPCSHGKSRVPSDSGAPNLRYCNTRDSMGSRFSVYGRKNVRLWPMPHSNSDATKRTCANALKS